MSAVWEGYRLRPRSLAGATVLQIVPQRGGAAGHALETANILLQAGARTIVASEGGPLAEAVRAAGAEWLPFAASTLNPLKLRRSVNALEQYATAERIDVVHGIGAGPAWIARMVAARTPMWVVTSLPDYPNMRTSALHFFDAALVRGDRVFASSSFAAKPWVERYRLSQDRIAIVPRSIDTATFAPSAVAPHRVNAVRAAWRLRASDRAILAPGRLIPDNGQMAVLDCVRGLMKSGLRNLICVFAGDGEANPSYLKALTRRVRASGVESVVRMVGLPTDLPAALAAAHTVVVPVLQPPAVGRIVAHAQAMGRPVIASNIGVLPENLIAPPRMSEDLRTGWLVNPGDAASLGRALHRALSLDRMQYQALAARARRFAEFTFAPDRVAAATCAVYSSLLARDT